MSVAAKHAYRFEFLRSEQWETIRIAVLAKHKGRCWICGLESLSNDVHHVEYPDNWWNTKPWQCVPLCRECHDAVHQKLGDRRSNWSLMRRLMAEILSERGTRTRGRPLLQLTAAPISDTPQNVSALPAQVQS